MVTTGGIIVVAAAGGIEAFGDGGTPDQHAVTVTMCGLAAFTLIVGGIFGATQWRKATVASAQKTTT